MLVGMLLRWVVGGRNREHRSGRDCASDLYGRGALCSYLLLLIEASV